MDVLPSFTIWLLCGVGMVVAVACEIRRERHDKQLQREYEAELRAQDDREFAETLRDRPDELEAQFALPPFDPDRRVR